MNESSVILTVNEMVFSTSTVLSGIEFNCKIDFVGWAILFPSNSRVTLIPLSFWIVNAVNSYIPIIEKNSSTFFAFVSNIPSELDNAVTNKLLPPFGSVISTLTNVFPSSSVPTNTIPSSIV